MPHTREEHRLYMREWRKRRAEEEAAALRALHPATTAVEIAVRAEPSGLAGVDTHPGLAAACLVLAKTLDDPGMLPHHAAAARSLTLLLGRIHEASRGATRGKLAAMRHLRAVENPPPPA